MPANITPEDLASAGFYLFPCNGKTPLVKWSSESSTDLAVIQTWATRFPDCNWGIDCGKSNLAVLDVDSGKTEDAEDNLLELLMQHGELPETCIVRTQSGGLHYYFRGDIKNSASTKLGKGLDTRGSGGYVVAPCSPGYNVIKDHKIAEVPEWLVSLVGAPTKKKEQILTTNVELDTEAATIRAIKYLAEEAAPAIQGAGGDEQTYKVACRVRDFGISREACFNLMLDHYDPRCQPPWGELLESKVTNAYAYAGNVVGASAPQAVFSEFVDPATTLFIEANALLSRKIKIDYLIHQLIETPSTGLIFGDPSSGKSFLAIDMACAIACGTSWMGKYAQPGIAVYFAGEGRQGVQRRIAAWKTHYGIDIPDNRLYVSEKRIEFSTQSLKEVANELRAIEEKTGRQISACFVDTLARHMPSASDENSARDMGGFINAVDWLRDQFNCVVAVVHHSGKMNKDTSRGSSAIRGAMDWEFKVSEKKGLRAVIFTKQKESELPEPMGFALKQVDIGEDTSSAVPISCEYNSGNEKLANLSSDALLALSVLQFGISQSPNPYILEKEWQKAFYESLGEEVSGTARRQKFSRVKKQLLKSVTIEYVGDKVFDVSLDALTSDENEETESEL